MDTSEEKYPLLLLYAEDGGRRVEYQKRSVFNENNRGKKIIQGATTIITQWPGHMTTCWITALCFGILLICITMFLSYSMENSSLHKIHPKCLTDLPQHFNNKTVHIPHQGDSWDEKQLEILQHIINVYKDYEVHISIFESNKSRSVVESYINHTKSTQTVETTKKSNTKTTAQKQNMNDSSLLFYDGPLQSFDAFTFFEKLRNNLRSPKRLNRSVKNINEKNITFEDIVNNSNVKVDKYTYEEYFKNMPLYNNWMNMDENMLVFASRVQELWQYGGISFYIPPNYKNVTTHSTIDESKNASSNLIVASKEPSDVALKSVILTSKSIYENLPTELVSIDRKGYHMGSKIPCHSFFGELVAKITAKYPVTTQVLIEETLREFCKRGAVNTEDCKII